MKQMLLYVLLFFVTISNGQENPEYAELNLDSIFTSNQGTFVLYNLQKIVIKSITRRGHALNMQFILLQKYFGQSLVWKKVS